MTPWWAILVSGLASGLLAVVASIGAILFQQSRIDQREAAAARSQAYLQLLMRSMAIAHRAQILMTTARVRSGLREGLDVTFRLRPAVDPMALYDWLAVDLNPAFEASSAVWLSAPQDVVKSANGLLLRCGDVVSAATTRSELPPVWRLVERVNGAAPDHGQDERVAAALRALGAARRDFAVLVRKETGQEHAELFLGT
jgi:hypothetical protein